ncbi:hypothetical protein C8R46DRAFT_1121443, partial [Mycena filopes]
MGISGALLLHLLAEIFEFAASLVLREVGPAPTVYPSGREATQLGPGWKSFRDSRPDSAPPRCCVGDCASSHRRPPRHPGNISPRARCEGEREESAHHDW